MEDVQKEDKVDKKKITRLLLNTPGACFLCLQENERDDDEDEGPDKDLNGGIIDLTTVCRYLNIDQCSLLLTSLENEGDTGFEQGRHGQCTFSVNLCDKCLELTRKLNDMIVQLERPKLMVNFHLKSFHKALEGNEDWEESLEWINHLGRMHTSPNNSFEAKLVQLLREETRDKSVKILKKAEAAMPQVILSKCQVPPPPPPLSKDSDPPPPIPSTSTIPSAATTPSIKTLLSQLVTSHVIPSRKPLKSKLYRCPYCPNTQILGKTKFSVHLSCVHSDKLLSSHFPPSQPPSEQLCRHVLFSQAVAKAARSASSSTLTATPRLACHLCGVTYSKGNYLKQHFLISHTDKLCEEIANFTLIPRETNTPKKPKENKKIFKPTSTSPPVDHLIKKLLEKSLIRNDKKKCVRKYECSSCGSQILKSRDFIRHLTNSHPDKLLAPFTSTPSLDKLKSDNPNHLSQLCKKVLASQLGKAKASKIRVAKSGGEATSSSSKSSKFCCHLCPKTCCDRRNLKHHLLVDHNKHLCEQLIKMQNMKIEVKRKTKGVEGKLTDKEGGDHIIMEEDEEEDAGSEFDLEPEVDEFNEMLHPDTVLDDEVISEEEGLISNLSDEQLESPDNESAPPTPQIVKMEFDEEEAFLSNIY